MKQIFIVRHGQSPFQAATDFERELSALGKQQAQYAGRLIAQKIAAIQSLQQLQIIASAANRTTMTAQQIQEQLPAAELLTKPELYEATVGEWCEEIANSPADGVILVGHNPTISQLSAYLSQTEKRSFSPATTAYLSIEQSAGELKLPAQLHGIFPPEVKV